MKFNNLIGRNSVFSLFILAIFVLSNVLNYISLLGYIPSIRLTYIFILLLFLMLYKLIFKAFRNSFSLKLTLYEIIGWSLVIWIIILHFIWYPQIVQAGVQIEFWKNAANTLLLSLLMWTIGLDIGRNYQNLKISPYARKLFWIVFIILGALTIYSVSLSWINYRQLIFYFIKNELGQGFDYLRFGDALALWSLMFIGANQNHIVLQLVIYILTALFLFFSFSRTSFYLFTFWGAIFLLLYLKNVKIRIKNLIHIYSYILLLISVIIFFSKDYYTDFQNIEAFKRMFSFIFDPEGDVSLQGRIELLKEGLNSLKSNWLLGQYMTEWWYTGELGGYIHNWLSFLNAYGIGPFIIFNILIIMLFNKSYTVLKKFLDPTPLVILLFTFSAIILTRSYIWPFIWFSLGFVITYKRISY